MAKFFMKWEIARNRLADDPMTIAKGWQNLLGMVKQDLEMGKMKEWGAFPGELGGFGIIEGSVTDVMMLTIRYAPFVEFEIHPLASVAEVYEILAAAAK